MSDYKERITVELSDLRTKLDKLEKFTTDTEFTFGDLPIREQDLLILQVRAMHTYAVILRMRLGE